MNRSHAVKAAYPAVLGALSLILVYLGAVVPSGNWGMIAVAGLFPAAAVISVGMQAGFICWAGVSILAFFMIPDKFCVLLFAALFGLYPMLKALIERLHRRVLEYFLKLVFFNLAFTVIYLVMKASVLASLPEVLHAVWLLYLAGNLVFLLYDYGFSKLISLYIVRIQPAIRKR